MSAPTTRVAILPSADRYGEVVAELLAMADLEGAVARGDSVLIKPNLHQTQHWSTGGTVNPALVAALIRWARQRGAGHILVADGPYAGHPRPEETFTETGMAASVEQAGAEWTVFPRHPYRRFRNVSPHLPPELGVSALVFDADVIINTAVMKTHLDCMATLAMKNLKGCIQSRDKTFFHQHLDIDRALLELNRIVTPAVNIVDGTVGMEGIGPGEGTPAGFGHILAGGAAPAVDLVAADLMGLSPEDVPVLEYARRAGLLHPESVRAVGERPEQIRRRFERPYEAMRRELPGLRLQSEGACSGCKLKVIRALRDRVRDGRGLPERPIVIGTSRPQQEGALSIGRCQKRWGGAGRWLSGCPPHVDCIKEFLDAEAQGPSTA